MTYTQVVKYFGGQAAAARALGIKPPSISQWKKSGITKLRQLHIERVTKGALRADFAA